MARMFIVACLLLLSTTCSLQNQVISSGNGFQSAIIDQQVYVWGRQGRIGDSYNVTRTIGIPIDHTGVWAQTRVIALSSGVEHMVALEESGKIYSWGDNTFGQIGDGNMGAQFTKYIPTQVNQATGVLAGKQVKQLVAGGYHSLVLTSDNQLFAWGYGLNGNLGDNGAQNQANPVQVNTTLLNNQQITQITAGHYHSLLLTNNGTIYSWGGATGFTNHGQLGNGATNPVGIPSPINMTGAMSGKQAVKISTGAFFSLALTNDGILFAWGDNSNGQLGIGNMQQQFNPVQVNMNGVLSGKSITQIATGYYHCLILTSTNQLVTWGKNTNGELGNGTYIDALFPTDMNMSEFRGRNISQITAGLNSLVLTSDDALFTWGSNTNSQIGDGTNDTRNKPTMVGLVPFTPIMAGNSFSMALSTSKSTYRQLLSWGWNGHGQLGIGTNTNRKVATFGALNGKKVIHLAEQDNHALAITSDGTLYSWGRNGNGQLGDGTMTSKNTAGPVNDPNYNNPTVWQQVSAGFEFILAINDKGRVYAWGYNYYGQLGIGIAGGFQTVPVNVSSLSNTRIIQVAAGYWHSLALTFDGQVYSWGRNIEGQLGINSTTDTPNPTAVVIPSELIGIPTIKIAAGYSNSMLLTMDGRVYCWGDNYYGQLGIGNTDKKNVPVAVNATIFQGRMIKIISCGIGHTIAMANDKSIYSWGDNRNGQLGDGTIVQQNSPVSIGTIPGTIDIPAGSQYSLLATNSSVYAWGWNGYGQLGDNTNDNRNTPTRSLCAAGYEPSWFCAYCPGGKYSSVDGESSCLSCSAGTASNIIGATSARVCQPCDVGQYSLSAAASCTNCPAGTYSSTPNAISCQLCFPGYYSNGTRNTQCSTCPSGTFSPIFGSTICTACPRGSYSSQLSSTSCTLCPIGTYNEAIGSTLCMVCPPGSISQMPGSSSCAPCDAGSFSIRESSSQCTLCPPGTHSQIIGSNRSSDCVNCPAGYSSVSSGSTSCSICPLGTYSTEGATSCQKCPAGTYSDINGTSTVANCKSCSPGTYSPNFGATSISTCLPCPKGTFSLGASSRCTPCVTGTYSPTVNTTSCSYCTSGTYADTTGAVNCTECPSGTANANNGATSSSDCRPCGPGTRSLLTVCQECSSGYYSNGTQNTQCSSCPPGTISPIVKSVSCTACPAGSYSFQPSSTSCILCPIGTFSSKEGSIECEACAPGTISPTPGSMKCTQCNSGSFAIQGSSTQCTLCPPGTHSQIIGSNKSSDCVNCPAGYSSVSSGSTSCSICPLGTYSTEGATSCQKCPMGTYSDITGTATVVNCKPCPPGTYSSELGAISISTCTPCPMGSYSAIISAISNATCSVCLEGYYASSTGQTSCSLCPRGTFTNTRGSAQCKNCTIGTSTQLEGSTSCVECPSGTYGDLEGTPTCLRCPAGTSLNKIGQKSNTTCEQCAPGTYASSAGQSSCTTCPWGTYSMENRTGCIECPIGTFSEQAGASTRTVCKACPQGTYNPNIAAATCLFCPSGHYHNKTESVNVSDCIPCPLGQYASAGVCYACPSGTFSTKNALFRESDCERCPKGTFSAIVGQSSGSTCIQCPVGFFANEMGNTNCIPCGKGNYSLTPGSIECEQCPAGSNCAIGSQKPSNSMNQSIINSHPATVLPSDVSSPSSQSTSTLVQNVFIVVGVGILAALLLTSIILVIVMSKSKRCNNSKLEAIIAYIDYFSLRHYVKRKNPLIKHATWLGGIMTVVLFVLIFLVMAIVITDLLKGNILLQTITAVPGSNVNHTIVGDYSIYLTLRDFGDSDCTAQISASGFTGNISTQNFNDRVISDRICSARFTCAKCILSSSSTIRFSYPQIHVMASAIEYVFTTPFFDEQSPYSNTSVAIQSTNDGTVFRGEQPTQFPISVTLTKYERADSTDFYFFGVPSKFSSSFKKNVLYGYTVQANPVVTGSLATKDDFSEQKGLKVEFSLALNANAYLIQQIGKTTIADSLSKMFALASLVYAVLAMLLRFIEKNWEKIQDCRRARKKKREEKESELQDMGSPSLMINTPVDTPEPASAEQLVEQFQSSDNENAQTHNQQEKL